MNCNPLKCLLAALAISYGPAVLTAAELNVFAAASLADVLKFIAAPYEKQSGDRIALNLAASSVLARQIEEGAPADIFFSADEAKMDGLEKNGFILPGTRKSRLSNSLVIVAATDSTLVIQSARDLLGKEVTRLALADPRAVPAGIYARQYLEKLGLWAAVKGKVVPTDNVRAALAAVESGNVEVGIVYKTDARISKKVRVAHEIPVADGPAVSYPVAVMQDTRHPEAAKRFLDHLESDDAQNAFERFGFIVRK